MKSKHIVKVLALIMITGILVRPLEIGATNSASGGGVATPDIVSVSAGGKMAAGDVTLNPTTAGISTVKSIPGVAVTESAEAVNADLGIEKGEKAFTSSYDITSKSAPASSACINAAAQAQGAKVLGSFNMNVGKIGKGGKYVAADGSIRVTSTAAIPSKAIDPAKTYAVVVVSPGGSTRIEPDQDTNPKTVTFSANGGLGAYALISY